jgi:hypothetical protein
MLPCAGDWSIHVNSMNLRVSCIIVVLADVI